MKDKILGGYVGTLCRAHVHPEVVAGAGFPPISGRMKALWPRLVEDPAANRTAYVAESLIQQVLLLIAPLLATALIAWIAPAAALWAAALSTLLNTAFFVYYAARVDRESTPVARRPGSALSVPAIRILVAATFLTPVAVASYLIVDDVAPPAHRTEAFTWLSHSAARPVRPWPARPSTDSVSGRRCSCPWRRPPWRRRSHPEPIDC